MTRRRDLVLGGIGISLVGGAAALAQQRDMGSMQSYKDGVAGLRSTLQQNPDMPELIRFATLAANSHNTQPWRFKIRADGVDIRPDFSRRLNAVDPDDHHLFASLGCAAENLRIAASMRAKGGALIFDPTNGGAIGFVFESGVVQETALFDAIPKRQSTRGDFDRSNVSNLDLSTLAAAAANVDGVDPVLITDRTQINRVRDLVVAGNTAQMADAAFVRELKSWLRFNPRQALTKADGLFSATSGNPILPTWLGPTMFDVAFKAAAENDKYARQIASSAGIAVFVSQKDDAEHWVAAGRACQRFALQATALGLKHAHINQPVEVADLRPELAALVGMRGRRPDIVMRFGYGAALPFSVRRPVSAVLL